MTKRKARLADREYAAELARLYRERHPRIASAGMTASTERRGLDIGDALEWFAAHGTFEKTAADVAPWNALSCRVWFKRYRDGGMSPEDAIAEIVEATGLGDRTVRGAVYSRKDKPAAR